MSKGAFPNVGLLYAARELLKMAVKDPCIHRKNFLEASDFILSSPRNVILDLCDSVGWIVAAVEEAENSPVAPTKSGQLIAQVETEEQALRLQLEDCIKELNPHWKALIPRGINFTQNFVAPPVRQIFNDAQLFDPSIDEVRKWWDKMLIFISPSIEEDSIVTGRIAEKLTIAHELERTGATPVWMAILDNSSGYDVLSVNGPEDRNKLRIEVKGTTAGAFGYIHITRNEWRVAETTRGSYIFHVWLLDAEFGHQLIQRTVDQIASHIPVNQGQGKWETTEIPISSMLA